MRGGGGGGGEGSADSVGVLLCWVAESHREVYSAHVGTEVTREYSRECAAGTTLSRARGHHGRFH